MAQSLEQIFTKASQSNDISSVNQLLQYGRQKGFQNFINRKLIWPFLLGVDTQQLGSSIYDWQGHLDKNSSDFQQLQKDAERAFGNMKIFDNITKFHLQKKQKDVLKILDSFFSKNSDLRYIQGFHDVASIFLILFGKNTGYYMMERTGKTYFRDYLTKDIGMVGRTISELVLELLLASDEQFRQIFQCFSEMKLLMFIVPWILTWFAHVFSSTKTISRIWDYLFCTGPHGIVYLTAGVIIATKKDLKESVSEFEVSSLHAYYQQMVKREGVDIEEAISVAIRLEDKAKLTSLTAFARFQGDSIFRAENFDRFIDLHRRAREYNLKVEQDRSKMIKKALMVTAGLAIGGFLFVKYGKKLQR